MYLVFSLLLLHVAVLIGADYWPGWLDLNRNRDPVKITPKLRRSQIISEKWIEQKLDHFNPHDNRTWKMRYFSNSEHFKSGGAIVIFIGGEWQISQEVLMASQVYDIAKQNSAYMFYTEHRFYGISLPTPDASTKNLQYLSVEQALADLAHFVKQIKHMDRELKTSKVVVMGVSYSGSLATWFRLKYPHLVDAAWASSAPLLAIADNYKYFEVFGRSLTSKGGPECYEIFEKGMQQLQETISAPDGPNVVAKLFNLCTPVEPNSLDFANFIYSIAHVFANVVQDHDESEKNIQNLCSYLQRQLNESNKEIHAIAEYIKRTRCFNVTYLNMLNKYGDSAWGNGTANGMRQWIYQCCTQLGFAHSYPLSKQPPGYGDDLDYFPNMCKDLFKEQFTENARQILENGVKRLNTVYQGLNPAVTKVIFTYGSLDPCNANGIMHDLNDLAPVIVIKDASHCQDLIALSPMDWPEMKAAKLRVQQLISEWLGVETSRNSCVAENSVSAKSRPKKFFRNRSRRLIAAKNREL